MTTAYLGLGANLGDPVQQILDARTHLAALPGTSNLIASALYITNAVGSGASGDFVNSVVKLSVASNLDKFFAQCQELELELGRQRNASNRNAPRLIDIDLLLFGDEIRETAQITLPHPRMHKRLFVLLPLTEINPELTIPGHGDLQMLLETGQASGHFDGQEVLRLGG